MAWPTTDKPRDHFVTLRLNDDEDADLNWLKTQTSAKDRSDAVRKALSRVVAAERKRAARQKTTSAPGPAMRGEDE